VDGAISAAVAAELERPPSQQSWSGVKLNGNKSAPLCWTRSKKREYMAGHINHDKLGKRNSVPLL
jgi:hypothetical protein